MNKKILFLILLGVVLVSPSLAFADLCGMLISFKNVALQVGGTIVVIGWIIVGILYLTAAGSPEKIGTAKKALVAVVIGTILVIIATAAYDIVNNALNAGGNGVSCENIGGNTPPTQ